MEKTYYKTLCIKKFGRSFEATFEISDSADGFFMPVTLTDSTEKGVVTKVEEFLGENSIDLNSSKKAIDK